MTAGDGAYPEVGRKTPAAGAHVFLGHTYEEKLAYVRENPLRENLVKNAGDWPFQGRIHDVQWIGD
jgi:hypothetical protein